MAIKGIDTRLDALAKSIEQSNQVEPDLAAIQPPQGGEPETEPVEVAGLGTVIEVLKLVSNLHARYPNLWPPEPSYKSRWLKVQLS